jgi:bifunctional non-homologous end joining protein LigD
MDDGVVVLSGLVVELATTERVQPRFIEPEAVRELPDGGLWTYEAKFDGYRCLAAKRAGGVVLWSRRGNLFTTRFPEIARACEKLPAATLVDGEVVAIDKNGRASFNALQHSRSDAQLQYYVFDILVHGGRRVLRLPLEERRELLAETLAQMKYPVLASQAFDAKPADIIWGQRSSSSRASLPSVKGHTMNPAGEAAPG